MQANSFRVWRKFRKKYICTGKSQTIAMSIFHLKRLASSVHKLTKIHCKLPTIHWYIVSKANIRITCDFPVNVR